MWHDSFDTRLQSWRILRHTITDCDLVTALTELNNWWSNAPFVTHYLHWDDRKVWPSPWELLYDNLFCSLARAVGISYTLLVVDRPDITDASLVQTENDNLVLVNGGKYIMNWAPGELLNIQSTKLQIKRHLDVGYLLQHLGKT